MLPLKLTKSNSTLTPIRKVKDQPLQRISINGIGPFQSIKNGVLLIFSFITSDKTEFLSPMMLSKDYITGI